MGFSNKDSLLLHSLVKTFASPKKVYPTLALPVQLTATTTAWVLGSFTEIVPSNAITDRFRIDYISCASFSAANTYEVVLYAGALGSETEIGRTRVHPGATANTEISIPMFTELQPANTRISAKIATSTGVANTVYTSIVYHIDAE